MLVYDITNEKSFDNIKNWIRNIEEVCLARDGETGDHQCDDTEVIIGLILLGAWIWLLSLKEAIELQGQVKPL